MKMQKNYFDKKARFPTAKISNVLPTVSKSGEFVTIWDIILRIACGAGIGFFIGLTGVGGGVLVLPTLSVLLGLPTSVAVGTASLYTVLTKLYATFEHFRLKTIDVRVSLLFLIGAVPLNIATSTAINVYLIKNADSAQAIEQFQGFLKSLVIIMMVFSFFMLIWNLKRSNDGNEKNTKMMTKARNALGIILGALVGIVIGATSIGGGVLVIPILIIFFGLTASRTVGSSILIAVVLTLATAIVYGKGGQMDVPTGITMWAGSIVGVYFGSRLCSKVPEKVLRVIVIIIIACSAISMVLSPGRGH